VTSAPHGSGEPSPWVVRFAPLVPAGGVVLDVAAGAGRHTTMFLARGHPVVTVDRDVGRLAPRPNLTIVEADLESGPWPLGDRRFTGVVVTNYLHRPLFAAITDAVAESGVLIYETFAQGNERFGKPSNLAFLLRPGELLDVARARGLRVLAYEDLTVETPRPACVQRIAATRA